MQAITLAGETLIAQVQANSAPLLMDRFVLANVAGLDYTQPVDRSQGLPAAQDIVHEAPIHATGFVQDNKVVYSLVLDTTVGNFSFNWLGLVTADDQVFFVSELYPVSKNRTVGTVQGDSLTRNVLLQFQDAQNLTGITVPAEFWQLDFSQTFQRVWRWAHDGYLAVNGDHLVPENHLGPMTIRLPPNPTGVTVVTLRPSNADYRTQPVTIDRNGNSIMGLNDDVLINDGVYHYEFRWDDLNSTWQISRTGIKGQTPQ